MGMEYVPGRHNDPERFYGKSRRVSDRDQQRAGRLGQATLPRWDRETASAHRPALQEAFAEASSWQELEERLAQQGLEVMRKGQGLVIGNETGTMKLSDLGRNIRLKGLEERFGGSFTAHDQARQRRAKNDEPDARGEAFEHLKQASEQADVTFYMYRMGLATRDQLERSLASRKKAQDDVDDEAPLTERLSSRIFSTESREDGERNAAVRPEPKRKRTRGRSR
jgi:hypothetical protein